MEQRKRSAVSSSNCLIFRHMLSGFISQHGEVVHYHILRTDHKETWNSKLMQAQLKEAIQAGEKLYPNCTLVFMFDHS